MRSTGRLRHSDLAFVLETGNSKSFTVWIYLLMVLLTCEKCLSDYPIYPSLKLDLSGEPSGDVMASYTVEAIKDAPS